MVRACPVHLFGGVTTASRRSVIQAAKEVLDIRLLWRCRGAFFWGVVFGVVDGVGGIRWWRG